MLLKYLHLKGHPVLGDLHLDFVDPSGVPFHTIILAGANGTGKTVILDTIQSIFEFQTPYNRGSFELEAVLDASNVGQFRNFVAQNPHHNLQSPPKYIDSLYLAATGRGEAQDWRVELRGGGDTIVIPGLFFLHTQPIRAFCRSNFTEASVNFVAREINSATAMQLDDGRNPSTRSGGEVAHQISQLLVDLRAADAEDVLSWVQEHPDVPPPLEIKTKRMGRFIDAFAYMFPSKRFKAVHREDRAMKVLFEENGRTSDINALSTGEKQIVFRGGFLLRNISAVQSGLLLVDEPELSLHPEWQARIVGFYRRLVPMTESSSTQLFVATHSPFIVHAASSAKVIILEKDASGVRVMRHPTYPSAGGNLGIVAFNIDPFLASARYDLKVLVEGDSDVSILNTAWERLYPNAGRFFEVSSALSASMIRTILKDEMLRSKTNGKVVGLFDFDESYNEWNGVWKAGQAVVSEASKGLMRRHLQGMAWSMLLPVPPHRADYASEALGSNSILSIEFMFPNADIPPKYLTEKALAVGQKLPVFRKKYKMDFAEHVKTLPKESFAAFETLFQRWREIRDGAL